MVENILKLGIGTKESIKLEPKVVVIKMVKTETKTKGIIVECLCAHPDREELIKISKVKIELKSKLSVSGLWVNLDDEEKLVKSSALAKFLVFNNCKTIEELANKTIATVEDESGYLVFKAY